MTRKLLFLLCLLFTACSKSGPAPHPDEAAVRAFIDRYFSTWSARDMEGYGSLFDDKARVFYLEKNGSMTSEGKTDFLHSQKMAHSESKVPMNEVPLDVQISGDARACQVGVKWRLTQGQRVATGLDYFTLRKGSDGWKIASLLFYQD